LLEAINYALYGVGRGSRAPKPQRDGAKPGAKCEVELEFVHDERHCRVLRGPNIQKLEVDGERRIDGGGHEALKEAITELLGVGQRSFAMTFYARQSEIQALGSRNGRKELEGLLGIDQVRDACSLAADAVRDQKAVVRTLEDDLRPVVEAEKNLEEAENEAREMAPAVEAAEKSHEQSVAARDEAWRALTQARARAEEAFELDRRAAVLATEFESAQERLRSSEENLDLATTAAAEVEALKPEADRVEALEARDRTHELERQASLRAASLREDRREAEAVAVAVTDELGALEDQGAAIEEVQEELVTVRDDLEQATSRLLLLPRELTEARKQSMEAAGALRETKAAHALDAELASLMPLRSESAIRTKAVAGLEAETTQIENLIAEEQAHLQHVREDGPKAICTRCKRPYGSDYQPILANFESALAGFEQRGEDIQTELRRLRDEESAAELMLVRLREVEGKRAGIDPGADEVDKLESVATEKAARVRRLEAEEGELSDQREVLTARLASLESKLDELRSYQERRRELSTRRQESERVRDLYQEQLVGMGNFEYDEEAHRDTTAKLKEARAASDRCAELRVLAGQQELLKASRDAALRAAREAEKTHKEAVAASNARGTDKDAQAKAETAYEATVEALDAGARSLAEAQKQALEESAAVEAARAELKNAKHQAGRLDKAKREFTLRQVVAAALEAYRGDLQRQAVPSLAQETADLLRSVTRGRYSDVQISAEGELEVIDRGNPHALGRFSGGEKDIANLCLRIGLSKVLSRRSGTETGFIILDEVLGSQDRDRRAALVQALRELDFEFGQVFVVSHFDDFMEHCALQITVDSVEGSSRASIMTA
jgi:exonuclease SbcC